MTWCTREFSALAWERIAGIRGRIDQLRPANAPWPIRAGR